MDLRTENLEELCGISLCAGYAGIDLGLHIAERRYRSVCFVEREAHAAATLVARMADQALDQAPIWDDLRTFDGSSWRGRVHLLTAGYPCQPFSQAGKRRGKQDPRHLWPEVARITREVEPEWLFCENVEGHISLGFAQVCEELREMGYTPKAGIFTAREAGGSHRRRRVFLLAHADSRRRRVLSGSEPGEQSDAVRGTARGDCERQFGAVSDLECRQSLDSVENDHTGPWPDPRRGDVPLYAPGPAEFEKWERILSERPDIQPAILRPSDGVADRLDQTRAAGNGVSAMVAAIAWRTLKAAHLDDLARA